MHDTVANQHGEHQTFTRSIAPDQRVITGPERLPHLPVQRRRLIDRIEHPFQAALTLIVAGAGYGKTTLAVSWAAQSPTQVGWLRLSEVDNEFASFVSHLRIAIRTGLEPPGVISTEQSLTPPPRWRPIRPCCCSRSALSTESFA